MKPIKLYKNNFGINQEVFDNRRRVFLLLLLPLCVCSGGSGCFLILEPDFSVG
jgi:hypothetical protein